jgi:hypothetical protein
MGAVDLIEGHHAPATVYCASVSDNGRRKPAFIARRAVYHCASLHLA